MKNVSGNQVLNEELETYRQWKNEAARSGRTPAEIIDALERYGQHEYAKDLREFIEKVEAAL